MIVVYKDSEKSLVKKCGARTFVAWNENWWGFMTPQSGIPLPKH